MVYVICMITYYKSSCKEKDIIDDILRKLNRILYQALVDDLKHHFRLLTVFGKLCYLLTWQVMLIPFTKMKIH